MNGTARRIAKNTASLMMADAVSKGLLFLLIILIARNLGDVTFGKYSFTFAFTSLFVVFADFGLSTLTIREIARNREYAGKYLGNISLIKLLLSIITGIFIVISINLLDYPSDTILAVYFAGAYVIVNSFNQFLRAFFRAFEKMEYEAVTRITERILLFIAVASMLHFGYGLVPIISVFFIVSVFNFFVTIVLVLKRFVKPSYEIDLKFCRGIIKEAIPFSLAIAFSAIYFRIDTVMLSLMQSDNVVGWYSAAYQILEGGTMLSVSFVSAIFPFFSKMHNNNEKHKAAFLKAFKYLFILGIAIASFITLYADFIISFLYGAEFLNSIYTLKILSWALFLIFLEYLFSQSLYAMNMQKINMYLMGICMILNILLNLILIPIYSHNGAAIATLLTEFTLLTLSFVYVNSKLKFIPY